MSTPSAARTRIAAAAIEASRSPAWNSRVDDQRQRLRPALDVAREHDRRPELAERARPAHHQPGGQRGAGERHRDRPEQLALRRAVDAGGVLEVAVDAGDPGPRRADEERRRHERLGEDRRRRRERRCRCPATLERRRRAARGGRTRAAAPARRPTAAGRSAGRRSPRPATCRGTTRRASTNASGRPNATVMTRLIAVVTRLSAERGEDRRRAAIAIGERAVEDRPGDQRRRPAAPRNSANRPASATSDAVAPASTGVPGATGAVATIGGGLRRRSPVMTAAGRNPNSARIAWPSGPANQSRKALRGFRVRRRLDDDAGVGRRDVGLVGHVDRRRPCRTPSRRSRRRSPASPSPSSILATTALTLSSFETMFAA